MKFLAITIEESAGGPPHTIQLSHLRKLVQFPDHTSVWESSSDVPIRTTEPVESILERIEALEPPMIQTEGDPLPISMFQEQVRRVVHAGT